MPSNRSWAGIQRIQCTSRLFHPSRSPGGQSFTYCYTYVLAPWWGPNPNSVLWQLIVCDAFPTSRFVIVRREGAKWCLPGLRPGEYPVQPNSGSRGARRRWNAGSKQHPVFVMRTQLPLAPGFAVTCHSAQGMTLDAAVVELNLPPGANAIAAYVAISRVRRREDLLILSHFKADVFRQGTPPDRLALLEHFRRLPHTY